MERLHAVGRRKTSVARIYMAAGEGKLTVNNIDYTEYFPTIISRNTVEEPFALSDNIGKYDVKVNVVGGGINGQAEAIRLAISRALVMADEENRDSLKKAGLLQRDPRMVERKKPGQPKARKRFQFRKR